jgi:hypothetical protein
VLAEGWSQCIMPQDYGERMGAQYLADLIAYIVSFGEERGPGGGPQDVASAARSQLVGDGEQAPGQAGTR